MENVNAYEMVQFSRGSYGDILWRIERERLKLLIDEFRGSHAIVDYLDFAAGTGRIISFVENLVDTAVGIEISEAMTKRASHSVKSARIISCDITAPCTPLEGKYDFITAFRFLLNAEPSLRLAALKALAARLRDDSSWLVFNNHGYTLSYRLLAYPFYKIRSLGKEILKANYLTHREVFQIADEAGLRIDRIFGYGVFSGKVVCMLPSDKAVRLEKFAAQNTALSKLGALQMYVARLK
ncbi:MAG: class I SAM-dependent methyltransferase [Candidatus Gracilibacteria bacterium]|nr:class I SAM-dependent methyltransferase [Candidatus Gracilibacteria bacterium]